MKRTIHRLIFAALGAITLASLFTLSMAPSSASSEATASGDSGNEAVAIFAGGCFWCMEPPYDKLDGVLSTTSGYIGGEVENPTYQQVSSGRSGHIEAVEIRYDPSRVSYAKLLEVFWRNIDPLAVNRQFCDSGPQYRSAIFPVDAGQRAQAEASLKALAESGRFDAPIATEILDATRFYPAEDYHQDYYLKNPVRYRYYRYGCGRDARLEALWGKADK